MLHFIKSQDFKVIGDFMYVLANISLHTWWHWNLAFISKFREDMTLLIQINLSIEYNKLSKVPSGLTSIKCFIRNYCACQNT